MRASGCWVHRSGLTGILRHLEIAESTCYRWRQAYAGMTAEKRDAGSSCSMSQASSHARLWDVHTARSIDADGVVDVVERLAAERGASEHLTDGQ